MGDTGSPLWGKETWGGTEGRWPPVVGAHEALVCQIPAPQPPTASRLDPERLYLVTNIPTGLPPVGGEGLPALVARGLLTQGYSPAVNFALLARSGEVMFCGNVLEWSDRRHGEQHG